MFCPAFCGFAVLTAQCAFSQEPSELPLPVGNGAGLEETAADVALEPKDMDPFDFGLRLIAMGSPWLWF